MTYFPLGRGVLHARHSDRGGGGGFPARAVNSRPPRRKNSALLNRFQYLDFQLRSWRLSHIGALGEECALSAHCVQAPSVGQTWIVREGGPLDGEDLRAGVSMGSGVLREECCSMF